MADKIVLVSDDIDFFDYIKPKLELRKSDELFCFSFEALIDKIYSLDYSLVIINSENAKEKTIDLMWKYAIDSCLKDNATISNANAHEDDSPLGVAVCERIGLVKIAKKCDYRK